MSNLAPVTDEIIKEIAKCKIWYTKAKNEWNSCNSLLQILVRIVQLEQSLPAGVQLLWEGGELSFLSTWRNSAVKRAETHEVPFYFTAVLHCWNGSWRQKRSTTSGSTARAVPGQAEHTGEVQVSITAMLPWTLSVVGVVSSPTGMSCRCVVSATVWVKPAEFCPHSARDSVAGNCTCPEQLHFWQETSHYIPFTTYPVRLVWRTWVWEQGDKDSYHVNWKGDTNIHQCLK